MYMSDLFTQLMEDGLPEPVTGIYRLHQIIRMNLRKIGGKDRYCPVCEYYTRKSNYLKHLETERHIENFEKMNRKTLKESRSLQRTRDPTKHEDHGTLSWS